MQKTALLFIGILIIAIFARTYYLGSLPPGLYPDEAMNGNNALEALATGDYKIYYPENNGREGLFINLQAQFLKILLPLNAGEPAAWMLRLVSALMGILTVVAIYFLGREIFGKRAGLWAAFFLATSFWHINFSRIGFRAIMAPLLLTLGLYFFLAAIRKNSNFWHAAVGGVVFGLGFHTYIAYRVMPLLFLVFVPFFKDKPRFWKTVLIFVAAATITALPIGIYYLENPADFFGRTAQVSVWSGASPAREIALNTIKTIGMLFLQGDGNWRHNYAGAPALFFPVAAFLLVGFLIGVKALRRKDDESFGVYLCLAGIALAMLPVVVSNEGIPHALRSILMLPPLLLLAGYGAHRSFAYLAARSENMARAALIIVVLILILQAYIYYFVLWAGNGNVAGAFSKNYYELGLRLREMPVDVPKYVIVDAGGVPVRGLPMPAQTVMFVTDTFRDEERRLKNIFYLLPEDENKAVGGIKCYLESGKCE